MQYLESQSNDPAFNLALEQYVFDKMDRAKEYFMLWQNDNAVIVGKHQNTFAEINREYVDANKVNVIRRLSGGGAVYHDMGNLNYTIIADYSKDDGAFNFGMFCEPVVKALRTLGVPAELNGRNDMVVDGKKFSGNAQYVKEGRIMHHGTLMYNSNLNIVAAALNVSKDKIAAKGVKSVRSRVTNIQDYMSEPVSLGEFKQLLVENMLGAGNTEPYEWTAADTAAVEQIKAERYGLWEWNYGNSAQFNVSRSARFDNCGKLELQLATDKGVIVNFDVYGDYFGNGDKADLQQRLNGCRLDRAAIEAALQDLDINYYFNNLSQSDFIALLLG